MKGHLSLECAQWLLKMYFLIEIDLAYNILTIFLELYQYFLEIFNLAHQILLVASILVPSFFSLNFFQFPSHIVQLIRYLCITLNILF